MEGNVMYAYTHLTPKEGNITYAYIHLASKDWWTVPVFILSE